MILRGSGDRKNVPSRPQIFIQASLLIPKETPIASPVRGQDPQAEPTCRGPERGRRLHQGQAGCSRYEEFGLRAAGNPMESMEIHGLLGISY